MTLKSTLKCTLQCVSRLKSYRCTSTSQDQILLSLIKQDDPEATGGLRQFTRGGNWIFGMLVYGNSTIITPYRGTYIWVWEQMLQQYQRWGEVWWLWFVRFGGFFPSLEIIQGQHMENRTQQRGRSVPEKNILNGAMHGSGNGQLTPARERFYQWRAFWFYNQHYCRRVEEGNAVYHICCIISQLHTRDLKNCYGNTGH